MRAYTTAAAAAAAAASSGIARVVAAELTVKDFRKQFFKADRPVVLEGGMAAWPALERWADLTWLRAAHGHRTVPVELGTHAAGTLRERLMTLREFVDDHLVGSTPETTDDPAYLAQHSLFDQIPELADDVAVPEYCQAGCHEVSNVWLGTANTATTLHFDSYDNFLCQVVGFKYVRLYSPSQTKLLYADGKAGSKSVTRAQGNLSAVDVGAADADQFPLFAEAVFEDTVLGPGDMLFIPNRWWHYVRSLSVSASCNFWF